MDMSNSGYMGVMIFVMMIIVILVGIFVYEDRDYDK